MERDPVFDITNLDDHELGHLEYIVNSPSWTQVFRPWLEKTKAMYTELLVDPDPMVRDKWGGDDYLRAGENVTRKMLHFFDKIIAETQNERAIAAVSKQERNDYGPETEF